MDADKYQRLKAWGGIFQQLRYQRTLSTLEKLTLSLLRQHSNDYDRCLRLFDHLLRLEQPLPTPDIAKDLGLSVQTLVQMLRALREGGFEFQISLSTANWYDRLEIPKSSMLRYLIEENNRQK